ncbi:N(4)-(Beta-N-acetylglucosaminyl)-L-asparaginase-like [Convolutriloba macropyga]|uniref:N(4)-(Beta-N-acetylglucosaminyl)-L-asparaginase- like n=1 Tax=Convolutriloba macropyga TaxID=536237 RepID=UPI003F525B10
MAFLKKKNSSLVSLPDFERVKVDQSNHDTIGIIAMNSKGQTAVAVSTNGLGHKIHGRVGDSPIVGAGAFARDGVGAAVQTGDGDVMLRFLPTFKVVEMMRQGVPPLNATKSALLDIYEFYPTFSGAIVAINSRMEYSASCIGFSQFQYCVNIGNGTQIIVMSCNIEDLLN